MNQNKPNKAGPADLSKLIDTGTSVSLCCTTVMLYRYMYMSHIVWHSMYSTHFSWTRPGHVYRPSLSTETSVTVPIGSYRISILTDEQFNCMLMSHWRRSRRHWWQCHCPMYVYKLALVNMLFKVVNMKMHVHVEISGRDARIGLTTDLNIIN